MKLKEINKLLNTNYKSFKEFQDKVDWYRISMYRKLSEDFIREFQDKVDWYRISMYRKLSEDFIREFQNKVDLYRISMCQKLSEDFIKEFQDKVNWEWISMCQKLSEDFIKEFQDKVDWDWISMYQKLSEGFIREFQDKVNWDLISEHQKLSEDFIREFNLKISSDNWLYKSTEFKKQQIINTNLYKCYKNYFIAYKSIRKDRYSVFNFQYKYLKDKIYESICDCTANESSFGLSAWTKSEALNYYNKGLIIKVKINYEDVGRLVHGSNKIRCFKFQVIS